MKILQIKILITLLLITLACSNSNLKSQKMFGAIEEEALKFDFFKPVRFNTNNNKYFKFEYDKNELLNVLVYIKREGDEVRITDSNGNSVDMENRDDYYDYDDYYYYDYDYDEHLFSFNITNPGVYILEFYNPEPSNPFAVDNEFTVILPGQIIETIDFSKNMYYNSITLFNYLNTYKPVQYKVKNLSKDTYVYFAYGNGELRYSEFNNPFEVCYGNNNCQQDITLFEFQSGIEYTINIYFEKNSGYNYYLPFVFFPIKEDTIQLIDKGIYKSSEPKIYNYYFKDEYSYLLNLNCEYFLIYISSKQIKKSNIGDIKNLSINRGKENIKLKETSQYYILIAIPPITTNEFMDDSTRVVIVDQIITKLNNVETIPSGKNALIYLNSQWSSSVSFSDYERPTSIKNYNNFHTYSSTKKNLQYVMSNKTEEFDFIIEDSYKNPIYIDKSNQEETITMEHYYPRYAFFGVMTNELSKSYLSFFLRSFWKKRDESEKSKVIIEPKLYLPTNIRVNSDLNGFYDFFNFYIKDFEEDINVYIKKIYGETEFYECNADSVDLKDLSFLTKPNINCENKKSVFNRLFSFKGSKIITGYLSPNSYFDIYAEYNDNENNIIKIPSYSDNTLNSASKYIRKDIEYRVDFDMDHMVKIETINNAEVIIYNEYQTIKLNSDNPNSKVEGKNFLVKTNIDTMIYFYGKLNSYIKQIKIDPSQKGKNIKILPNDYCKIYYCIDSGFEGYNPLNSAMKKRIKLRSNTPIFIENIYEKIKNQLVKGENLYFYYGSGKVNEIRMKLEYTNETINNPNNDYTFHVIQKDSKDKSLVLNNRNDRKIYMGVHFCKPNTEVKVISQNGGYDYEYQEGKEEAVFNDNEKEYVLRYFDEFGTELNFESTEDFIFSYSYFDQTDKKNRYRYEEEWSEERQELSDLQIIKIENTKDHIMAIRFNPNYIKSTTKYIIIVALEEGDNTLKNFENPCYVAKLATDKPDGVIIENFIFASEEKRILTAEVDISNILNSNGNYIVNIISQELRFNKRLNFYSPYKFTHLVNFEEINIGDNKEFDLSEKKAYFNLELKEELTDKKMFLLHYILDSENPLSIKIKYPNKKEENFNINNKEGFVNFLYEQNGKYQILFIKTETEALRSSNNVIKGNFEIVSTDNTFKLDINKNKIEFNEFTIKAEKSPSLKFSVGNLDKDLTKKFLISNYNNITKIVSIKKDEEEYKELKFNYYTFEKNSKYEVTINFHEKDENYVLEKINILDYSSLKIEEIFSNIKKFDDLDDKFYFINWKNIEKITITKKNKNPAILVSHISENQYKNLIKEIQNIEFNKLDKEEIVKPKNDYSVLMIELNETGTEINIELKTNNNNVPSEDDDDDDDDDKKVYIITICVLGGLLFIVLLILIIRCIHRGKDNNNFEEKTKDLNNEKLLRDI